MKKVLVVLFFMVISFQYAYGEIFESIYKALPYAQKENKLIAFFIVSSRCPHCIKLLNDMKNNQNLIDLLNNNYVTVIADISSGAKVPIDLPFKGNTPTMMVVTLEPKHRMY